MDLQLNNKKALVMGSSSGIGRAIAQVLVKEGAEVAMCARDEKKLKKAADEIGCENYFSCDLSLPHQGRLVCEKSFLAMGGLDILVTNTGGPKRGHFHEISDEQWHQDFQSLWMSVVESFKFALPHMKEKKFGRIILITSLAARSPRPGLTTSNGLRAGLEGLAKSVAREYAQYGITVNLVLPGLTNTDRLKELNLSDEKIRQTVPAGHLGQPDDIANLVTFLSSPLSGYITGQSIAVDGGTLI